MTKKDKNDWEKELINKQSEKLERWGLRWNDDDWFDFIRTVRQEALEQGYADCKKDMKEDLESVVGMLEGIPSEKMEKSRDYLVKIVNYIRKYLLEKQ